MSFDKKNLSIASKLKVGCSYKFRGLRKSSDLDGDLLFSNSLHEEIRKNVASTKSNPIYKKPVKVEELFGVDKSTFFGRPLYAKVLKITDKVINNKKIVEIIGFIF